MVNIRQYEQRVVEQASNPTPVRAPKTDLGALAEGVGDVGNMFATWEDEINTADAKRADADFTEKLNDILYNDQTGYMYTMGGDAVSGRATVEQQIDELFKASLDGLAPGARAKAETAMRARRNSYSLRVNDHAATSRIGYMTEASNARITAAVNSGIYEPSSLDFQVKAIDTELADLADLRGLSPDVVSVMRQEKIDQLYGGTVLRMASTDPIRAAEFLAENRDKLSGSVLAKLEADLVPEAKKARGRQLGAAAANGAVPAYEHKTTIEFDLEGKARPYQPDRPILDVIGKSVEDVFGPGAKVVVTSGQEGDLPQHGSNRHGTGTAADVAIYRPDGSRVLASDPDMLEISKAASARGAKGIGFGVEYMGGSHIHLDLVDPGPGQAHTWGSGAKAHSGDLTDRMKQYSSAATGDISGILEIEDPLVRGAALEEYELRAKIKVGEKKAAIAQAGQEAFTHVEGGGRVDDLPRETRDTIGVTGMSSLRAYEKKLAAREPVVTDPVAYLDLREKQAAGTLGDVNMIDYVNVLSPTDWQAFVDAQNKDPKETNAAAASTLMSIAKYQVKAAGLGNKQSAALQTELLQWQDAYIASQKKRPSEDEINAQVSRMMIPVVLDPPGMGNKQSGKAFEIDFDGKPGDPSDDITVDQMLGATLKINGKSVDAETMRLVAMYFAETYGRDPTPKEVVSALIDSGYYE